MGDRYETEANRANIHRFVEEGLNRGLLDVVDETRGRFADQSKRRMLASRHAFPDFHTTIENLVAEGTWVALHLRHQGTQRGEFLGVAPTDRAVDFRSMVFNRYEGGVVVENWGLHDHARALEQLTRP
jgi:predicted ester cyclase